MLTDKGSIKTACISVESALVAYRKKIKIISFLMLIVGAVGLVAYIVLGTVFEKKWLDALLVFAVPFTLGLIGTITIVRVHKRETLEPKTSRCEFFTDCFFCNFETVSTFQPTSKTDKFNYSDAVLKRENERYGYIFVFSKGIFVPFCKEDLTAAELNAIRKNFRKPVPDGAEIVKLEKFESVEGEKR